MHEQGVLCASDGRLVQLHVMKQCSPTVDAASGNAQLASVEMSSNINGGKISRKKKMEIWKSL